MNGAANTTSKIKRHPSLFTRENSALLVVDFQERFAPVLPDGKNTIENIRFLISGIQIYDVPIFVSEQVPEKLGPTVGEIKEAIKDAFWFSKKPMSCCGNITFVEELKKREINKVAVCGIEAHICVLQTSLDLINNGFQVHLISDAITSRVLHNKSLAIEKIKSAGGIVSSIETVLFEIAYEAGNDEFKKLQQLFKTGKIETLK